MADEKHFSNESTDSFQDFFTSNKKSDSSNLDIDFLKETIHQNTDHRIIIPELEQETANPAVTQEQSDTQAKGQNKPTPAKAILVFLATTILVCLVVLLVARSIPKSVDRRILNNVYIAGVDVSGMYQTEAISVVDNALNATLYRVPIKIMLPGQVLELTPEASAVKLDTKSAVEAAYRYGHSGDNAASEKYDSQQGIIYHVDITPYLQIDEQSVRQLLKNATDANVGMYAPSGYFLEGNAPLLDPENFDIAAPCQTLVLNKGVPGNGVDPDKLYEKVLNAYRTGKYILDVSTPDTERDPEELDLDLIYRILTVPPTDSTVDENAVTLVPGRYGYSFDLEAARAALSQVEYGTEVRIPMQYVTPGLKTGSVYFQNVLGSAEIPCNGSTLALTACKFANLTIVKPSQSFSLQATLLGLQPNIDCLNHPVEDDGICMVGSALFQSALKAGLTVQNPPHHNYTPAYCEKGFDVCASGYTGFQFTNSTEYPVILLAEVTSTSIRVQILGTETRNVSISLTSEVTAERDYLSQVQTYSQDSGYADGQIIQAGSKPCTVSLYRQIQNLQDGSVTSELIQSINYIGCSEIIAKLP